MVIHGELLTYSQNSCLKKSSEGAWGLLICELLQTMALVRLHLSKVGAWSLNMPNCYLDCCCCWTEKAQWCLFTIFRPVAKVKAIPTYYVYPKEISILPTDSKFVTYLIIIFTRVNGEGWATFPVYPSFSIYQKPKSMSPPY